MTWQRIDDDTYIDDTLVTCAEYQLFIDEMREQGKYFQPDHWTLYQFPSGQAREPILGMRHSDAVAFCEWLTSQESRKWEFHLPTRREMETFPMKTFGANLLGSWINEDYEFAWTGDAPTIERMLNRNPRITKEILQLKGHNVVLGQIICKAVDLNVVQAINQDIDNFDTQGVLIHLLSQFLNRSLNSGVKSRDASLGQSLKRAQKNHEAIFDFIQNEKNVTYKPLYERYLKMSLDSLVAIYVMSERIAGRSPAFEGIRLVKERIK